MAKYKAVTIGSRVSLIDNDEPVHLILLNLHDVWLLLHPIVAPDSFTCRPVNYIINSRQPKYPVNILGIRVTSCDSSSRRTSLVLITFAGQL